MAQSTAQVGKFNPDGTMSIFGFEPGTTCTVEWTSTMSLPGSTNWRTLASQVVTSSITTADWPRYFRASGVPDSHLLAFWPFDGIGADVSGNSNDASLVNISSVADRRGSPSGACSFNGTMDSYISVPDNQRIELTNDFSLTYWFYVPTNFTGAAVVMCKTDYPGNSRHWLMSYYNDGSRPSVMGFNPPYDDSQASVTNIPMGDWTHVAFTFHKADHSWAFYVNGILARSGADYSIDIIDSPHPVVFGREAAGDSPWSIPFPGRLDSVRIYDRILSPPDISMIFSLDP